MTHEQPRRRRGPGTAPALLAAALLAACAGDRRPGSLTSIELSSPAGPGSGEPFLSSSGDMVYMSWLEATSSGTHELRFSRFNGSAWGEASLIASGERFFVNWADFPSVTTGPDGTLWAHWLERGPEGGYDYGIRLTRSRDDGLTWSEPWIPHEDGSPTEHGFVSSIAVEGAMGFLWLDGRRFEPGPEGSRPTWEMALMFRAAGHNGADPGPEQVVDARVCDCCQTDAAMTSSGPVAVYRDRSPDEIRDISITRWRDGSWTEGKVVHQDGWRTAACPVNGPAVAARGEDVAVAWFSAAGGAPEVKVALSRDGGATFGGPVLVDGDTPAGRVDAVMLEDGTTVVSWLARTGGEAAEVRVMTIDPSGRPGRSLDVSTSSSERASGFPRMARTESGTILLAWTDVADAAPRVRVARIETEG